MTDRLTPKELDRIECDGHAPFSADLARRLRASYAETDALQASVTNLTTERNIIAGMSKTVIAQKDGALAEVARLREALETQIRVLHQLRAIIGDSLDAADISGRAALKGDGECKPLR